MMENIGGLNEDLNESRAEKILTNRLFVFFAMFFLSFLWGSAYPGLKIGYAILNVDKSHIPSIMLFAGVRYIITGLMLLIPGMTRFPKSFMLNRNKLSAIVSNMLFQVIGQYFFYYIGLARTPGTRAAIVNSTTAFIAVFLATFVFRTEKYSFGKVISTIIATASIIILNYVPGFGFSFSPRAEGFILASSFLSAVATCLQKKLVKRAGILPLCSYSFFFGGIFFTIYGLVFDGKISVTTASAFILLLYLAAISAIGFSVQALLLKYNDVSIISVYRMMLPLFGVALSAVFLNEFNVLKRWTTLVSLGLMVLAMSILSSQKRG